MQLVNYGRIASYFAVAGIFLLVLYDPATKFKNWRRRRHKAGSRRRDPAET